MKHVLLDQEEIEHRIAELEIQATQIETLIKQSGAVTPQRPKKTELSVPINGVETMVEDRLATMENLEIHVAKLKGLAGMAASQLKHQPEPQKPAAAGPVNWTDRFKAAKAATQAQANHGQPKTWTEKALAARAKQTLTK